jgi:ATP-dependent Lhr-like helicase
VSALAEFHPAIRSWFQTRFAAPTAVQAESWPGIAAGKHLLITAPTGSGKTLTAFLWALNQFATGRWQPGRTRVVYISPLKALNNDIQRNLLEPLTALREEHDFPSISVQTRSGDTPQSDRQRMLRRPPDILITTPESLSLLLTTARGRQALATVETLILDEIHSIVDNRRGASLMTSAERLVNLSGEFQRLALSATVNPVDAIASYVGGHDETGQPRKVEVVAPDSAKAIEFRVRFPEQAKTAMDNGKKIWDPLAENFRNLIEHNHSTLFFTNSRRLAEKITLKINEDQLGPIAYAHHGSLSREIRSEVESRLKQGELKAIVATSSLEMGIDVGHLDEVVMVQSPPSVAAALQRIGRAGHRVGDISVGTLFPTHADDFLQAAVLAETIAERDIEPLKPLTNALDVLAQIIISMCASESWPVNELFALVKRSAAYHDLPREQFDLLVEMLAGRYAGSRVRELKPRLAFDRINQTLKAQKGAVFALYNSGGTIPDRGYYNLRHVDSGAIIGELDEEFVWEATTGQTFTMGTQNWQVVRITHNDVLVRPAQGGTMAPPFWRAESYNRSFHFSQRIIEYLELCERAFAAGSEKELQAGLVEQRGFEPTAAEELLGYLARQRERTGAPLPHRHHLLIELVRTGPGGYRGPDDIRQVVMHTLWGARLNRPLGLALEAAWEKEFGTRPEIHADNNAIVIQLKSDPDPAVLTSLVTPQNLETLLRESLEGSGFFGARFRECAGRSLLLTRQRFNQRLPLWMSRLQAKKLMSATSGYSDFPVLMETWRTCLNDEFDLPALRQMLTELGDGEINWSFVTTRTPSPFASNVTFDQINRYMYADDTPEQTSQRNRSALSDDLIRSAVFNAELRPRVQPDIVATFLAKRQRTADGYRPTEIDDWLEWSKERILIPSHEIESAVNSTNGKLPEHEHLVWLRESPEKSAPRAWLTHRELLNGLLTSGLCQELGYHGPAPKITDPRSAEQFALEILSFYGPLSALDIQQLLPHTPEDLFDNPEQLIHGELLLDDPTLYYCDADNYEMLLRFQRAALRPQVEAQSAKGLPAFIANWQRFGRPSSEQNLLSALEQLRGYPAPVRTWLTELMPARLQDFADHQLDEALTQHEIQWLGVGNERITLGYPEDLQLLAEANSHGPEASTITELFTDPTARYGFFQLADASGLSLDDFNERWWQAIWNGEINADSLLGLRQGLARKFTFADAHSSPASTNRRSNRSNRSNRRSRQQRRSGFGSGWAGNWSLQAEPATEVDALTELEEAKDLARLLLDRYGFACRELANREGGALRWRNLFKALRLMELGGEVVAGYFFEGLSGPQFISPAGLNQFQQQRPATEHFWLNALDPASPCGLSLDWDDLPQRRAHNYLAFHAGKLALIIENNGRRLSFLVPPEHPDLAAICAPLRHLLNRQKRADTELINNQPARQSPYLEPLSHIFQAVNDHKLIFFENR